MILGSPISDEPFIVQVIVLAIIGSIPFAVGLVVFLWRKLLGRKPIEEDDND
ncbi:MAG TPA: hypothetical protein VM219_09410 [Phycisphaerae bacterium]|nr:hypothetical protein [Phycisphaerae bacterium]